MFSLIITSIVSVAIIYSNALAETSTVLGGPTHTAITAATNNFDEDSTFPGVWRGSIEIGNSTCQMEYVFQKTHKYSSTVVCGPYRAWQTGTWKIVSQGTMRFAIEDYEPKKYAGRDVYLPDSDMLYYRVINDNKIHLESRVKGVSDADIYRAR